MTIATAAVSVFIMAIAIVLVVRFAAIQRELDEIDLALLELFNVTRDENRRANLLVKSVRSSGGDISNETLDSAPGLKANLERVDAVCAELITLVPPANEVPLVCPEASRKAHKGE